MKTKSVLTVANRRITKLAREMLIILLHRRRRKLIVIMVSVLIKKEVEELYEKKKRSQGVRVWRRLTPNSYEPSKKEKKNNVWESNSLKI